MRELKLLCVALSAGMLMLSGCKSDAQQQAESAAASASAAALAVQAAQLAQAATKARDKSSLQANPEAYLETSDIKSFDKGIINRYRQLVGVTVLNKSHFAVNNLQGEVNWTDPQGKSFGTTPFSLKGSIPAGATVRFSTESGTLTSGTLEGEAAKVVLKFTHMDVID